jgi:hypothetical protein
VVPDESGLSWEGLKGERGREKERSKVYTLQNMQGERDTFYDWEHGRDLYVDVVGSSPLAVSYRENFVPGGAVERAPPTKWSGIGRC